MKQQRSRKIAKQRNKPQRMIKVPLQPKRKWKVLLIVLVVTVQTMKQQRSRKVAKLRKQATKNDKGATSAKKKAESSSDSSSSDSSEDEKSKKVATPNTKPQSATKKSAGKPKKDSSSSESSSDSEEEKQTKNKKKALNTSQHTPVIQNGLPNGVSSCGDVSVRNLKRDKNSIIRFIISWLIGKTIENTSFMKYE